MNKLTIPAGWSTKPICDVAKVVSGGTPSRYVPEFWENGTIPWVTPTDITATTGRLLLKSQENITERGLQSCGATLLPKGTLLMTSRATLGEIRIALGEVCTNQGFKSLVPINGTDGEFLYYQMLQNRERYRSRGIGSTFLEVNKRDTERFEILVAPRKEQRRIAEILSTVDDAIEQTEALIAKTQQIKAGLMHDLFTRGVLPNGQLRPPREEAPQLYKESPLGWVPREWEVQPVSALCELITVGIVIRPAQYYIKEGVPAIRSANIREESIDPADLVFISAEANRMLAKSQLRVGDVVSVRTGYPGTSSVVPEMFAGANCIDILISRPLETIRSNYLSAWINSSFGKNQVLRKQGGLAQQHFNVRELRCLLVGHPSIQEQDCICGKLSELSVKIESEKEIAEKYWRIKNGLMHDLLTGRVRVLEKVAKLSDTKGDNQ